MALSEILTFVTIAALLVMSPGPNGLLIAKTVPTSGKKAGLANVAGFVTAFYLHGALSILGISILLVQSATAFTIVKFLGALYLCWIGFKSLYAAYKGEGKTDTVKPARRKRTLIAAYIEGFLTNALNPKVSMFYLAAFPQFIQVGESAVSASFLLVFLHSMLCALWFTAITLLLSKLTRATGNAGFQRAVKAVTGVVFVGFGIKLATMRPNI
ncbi:MAG: LysE family translocator [Sneathiellales bacterium]|nr:LysE family translocator [Sneathiellales bacterium]